MENIAYKNRNKEINDVINFIFDKKHQIFLYESKQGYGNTAFMNENPNPPAMLGRME